MRKNTLTTRVGLMMLLPVLSVFPAVAADGAATGAAAKAAGMTLWQLIVAGGSLMIVLAFLSIAALAIIVYDFFCFKPSRTAAS